jgi:hypothetical protein
MRRESIPRESTRDKEKIMSKQITVSDEFVKTIEEIKKRKGYEDVPTAVDYIGKVFVSRFNAVGRYAKKQKGEQKPAKKAVKKAVKKAAKAKAEVAA